jgi:hypothetical protein
VERVVPRPPRFRSQASRPCGRGTSQRFQHTRALRPCFMPRPSLGFALQSLPLADSRDPSRGPVAPLRSSTGVLAGAEPRDLHRPFHRRPRPPRRERAVAWIPGRLSASFPQGPSWSLPASRPPVARMTCRPCLRTNVANRTASFTRFEALIPLRVRSRRRRPGCPGFDPGSPRSLLETAPCETAPSSSPVAALLGFAPPETSSSLGPWLTCIGPREPTRARSSRARPNRSARRPARERPDRVRPPHARPESHAGSTCSADTGTCAREGAAPGRAASRRRTLLPWPWAVGLPPGDLASGALKDSGGRRVSLSGVACLSWGSCLLAPPLARALARAGGPSGRPFAGRPPDT